MRLIAHISDLHFGSEDRQVAEALLLDLLLLRPTLVAISGDLTQRARRREFLAAKEFLKQLPFPVLTVPGNHDIPLYNLFDRLLSPYKRYRYYISDELDPYYVDEEIAVLGINTAHGLTIKNGRFVDEHVAKLERSFGSLDSTIFKVLVTHHHFTPPPGHKATAIIEGAYRAARAIESCRVDLMLAGHLHRSYMQDLSHHYAIERSVIVAQAGTAISRRSRGESNSYNVITVNGSDTYITLRVWNGTSFVDQMTAHFRKGSSGWVRLK
ncbi:MAG: metallophosphoesterase [Acidobacteriota bacterium]|nr:metallophosphoesterase [Blastocatellia bacterium]MDW8413588.1 metallophosphoesterase [Acidobacteriota bacterium]